MALPLAPQLKQVVARPDPIKGEVVDIDTGYETTIVLTVEADEETYYEVYELTNISTAKPST